MTFQKVVKRMKAGEDIIVLVKLSDADFNPSVQMEREQMPESKRKRKGNPAMGGRAGNRNPGIIETIVQAIWLHPMTKDQIVVHLHKKFPKRDPNKMANTIGSIVPTRINSTMGFSCYRDARNRYYTEK